MALPKAIARECHARVTDGPVPDTLGATCEGSLHHSPRPLVARRHTLPDGTVVHLCGTCWDNLSLLFTLQSDGEPLPWDALREFGNRIRDLGRRRT